MGLQSKGEDQDELSAMNMTPLIDVLLVLLVMFIITIPIATHSTDVDLGIVGHSNIDRVKNKVVVTDSDQILWNGDAVDSDTLRGLLARTAQMKPEPELQFEPEAFASFNLSARVVRLIDESEVRRFGFVGNDKYREFGQ